MRHAGYADIYPQSWKAKGKGKWVLPSSFPSPHTKLTPTLLYTSFRRPTSSPNIFKTHKLSHSWFEISQISPFTSMSLSNMWASGRKEMRQSSWLGKITFCRRQKEGNDQITLKKKKNTLRRIEENKHSKTRLMNHIFIKLSQITGDCYDRLLGYGENKSGFTHVCHFEKAWEVCHHVPMGEHDSLWVSCVTDTHTQTHTEKWPSLHLSKDLRVNNRRTKITLIIYPHVTSGNPGMSFDIMFVCR